MKSKNKTKSKAKGKFKINKIVLLQSFKAILTCTLINLITFFLIDIPLLTLSMGGCEMMSYDEFGVYYIKLYPMHFPGEPRYFYHDFDIYFEPLSFILSLVIFYLYYNRKYKKKSFENKIIKYYARNKAVQG